MRIQQLLPTVRFFLKIYFGSRRMIIEAINQIIVILITKTRINNQ